MTYFGVGEQAKTAKTDNSVRLKRGARSLVIVFLLRSSIGSENHMMRAFALLRRARRHEWIVTVMA
jgi:hypothetical protein